MASIFDYADNPAGREKLSIKIIMQIIKVKI